jgi:hypothetical protein
MESIPSHSLIFSFLPFAFLLTAYWSMFGMDCDGCHLEIEKGIPKGYFHIERDNHAVIYRLCKNCSLKVEHYILWRLD